PGLRGWTVLEAGTAAAEARRLPPAVVENRDLMMTGIGKRPVPRLARRGERLDLAGEGEAACLARHGGEVERAGSQHAVLAGLRQRVADRLDQEVAVRLAGVPTGLAAVRIDEHQARPGAHRIVAPDAELGVVHNRMHDAVACNGALDIRRVL